MVADALRFEGGAVRAEIDLRVYRLSAVQKAAYKLADKFTVLLAPIRGDVLPLTFSFPADVPEADARSRISLFYQELLDQELREKVGAETAPIRALLLAHAFAKTDLVRRDE